MKNTFPKLPDWPACMGFRKTITLNIDEYSFLKAALTSGIAHCIYGKLANPIMEDILEKLNTPTPPPVN